MEKNMNKDLITEKKAKLYDLISKRDKFYLESQNKLNEIQENINKIKGELEELEK